MNIYAALDKLAVRREDNYTYYMHHALLSPVCDLHTAVFLSIVMN
jgi:hypothetical protein